MDKLTKYRKLIKQLISDYEALCNSPPSDGVADQAIFDEEQDRYLLFRTGWWKKERIRSATLYVRLQNGKIWIEEDWTEDGIATSLLEAGVPREDIVLAFHPPEMRPHTEFAVA